MKQSDLSSLYTPHKPFHKKASSVLDAIKADPLSSQPHTRFDNLSAHQSVASVPAQTSSPCFPPSVPVVSALISQARKEEAGSYLSNSANMCAIFQLCYCILMRDSF